MKTVLLKGGFVVTPKAVLRTDILLRDGRIELATGGNQSDKVEDITGKYVVPGFVDIHFHGYNLFDFTAGLYDPETGNYDNSRHVYEQGFEMFGRELPGFGVTGFYLATYAAPIETLKNCYSRLADYMKKANKTGIGSRLLGALIEGTFINAEMAGAQNPELALEPTPQIFDSIEDGGTIKLANVAPEAGPQGSKLIEYLTDKGIVVGFGHTAATCNQVTDAIKAGLKYCIHFTNGPTGGSYKPFEGGGAIEAVLKFDELYAEQICDGYHVNPAYVRDIIKRKGTDKIISITDCISIAGSDVKEFTLGGMHGQVSDNGDYFHVVGKPNTLFSSNMNMRRGFKNLLNWLTTDMQGIWNRMHEAMDFEQALAVIAKMCSTNPCLLTGLDKEGYGSIVDGAKADLCVLDITGSAGDYKVAVHKTFVDAEIVYPMK